MVGIITGREITKNRDGTANRIILQVELLSVSGDDNNPATGCRVFITDADTDGSYKIATAVTDDLTPEVDPGEREIYSTDNPVTNKLAKIKLDKTNNVILNSGMNHATQQEALQTAINAFLVNLNAQLVGLGGAGGLTLDITTAKVLTVLVP